LDKGAFAKMRQDAAFVTITCDVCKKTQAEVEMTHVESVGYIYGYITGELEKLKWIVDIEPERLDICPKCAKDWYKEREQNAILNLAESNNDEGF